MCRNVERIENGRFRQFHMPTSYLTQRGSTFSRRGGRPPDSARRSGAGWQGRPRQCLYRSPIERGMGRAWPQLSLRAVGWRVHRNRATSLVLRSRRFTAPASARPMIIASKQYRQGIRAPLRRTAGRSAEGAGTRQGGFTVALEQALLRDSVAQHRGRLFCRSHVRRQSRQGGLETTRIPRRGVRRLSARI